jgi:hypothetical protein
MRNLIAALPFVALTFLSWGNYGPLMHRGTQAMSAGAGESAAHDLDDRLVPFIYVGVAYFLIAVVVPATVLIVKGEAGRWSIGGTTWSLAAGVITAVGALGIVLAMAEGGKPIYMMPLIFGCAPVVNTLVTMYMSRTWRDASIIFIAGIVVVALGAAGVFSFAPPGKGGGSEVGLSVMQYIIVLFWIAVTALCWGAYGPLLHKGQMKMQGSRLRPFMCVGLAYFAVAIVAPVAILSSSNSLDGNALGNLQASLWSLGAGAAGAIGSLGLILAFNFGGKPIFVMPLVFGCAPVVNTFTTMITAGTLREINAWFVGALAMVIAGAVTVLLFAPRGHGPKPAEAKQEPKPTAKPQPKSKPESTHERKAPLAAKNNGDGKPAATDFKAADIKADAVKADAVKADELKAAADKAAVNTGAVDTGATDNSAAEK